VNEFAHPSGALRTLVTGRPCHSLLRAQGPSRALGNAGPACRCSRRASAPEWLPAVSRRGWKAGRRVVVEPGVWLFRSVGVGCEPAALVEESPPGAHPGSAASAVAGLRRGAGTRCRTGVGFRQRRAPFLPATTPTYYETDLLRTLARSQQDDSPHPCAIHGSARPAERLDSTALGRRSPIRMRPLVQVQPGPQTGP